jgi:carbonic anhydrase
MGTVVNEQRRADRLVELNVVEQVNNVCHTTIVQDAWDRGQPLTVHGWVYGINDGKLQDMGIAISALPQLAPAVAQRLAQYEAA